MTYELGFIMEWLSQFVWTVIRISGFMLVVPVFANTLVPVRVKMAMSVAISILIAPTLTPLPLLTEINLVTLIEVFLQSFAGVALGFSATIFFHLFVVAGQFIAMQMGLGFAAMVDPGNGVQVTVWSQFYLMLVTLTYLSLDGHLLLLDVLVTGFQQHSYGLESSFAEVSLNLVNMGAWMFAGGALVALPAVSALLIVNITFGVMSRSAPQLNVFSLGFPFALLFGLLIVWWAIRGWISQYERFSNEFLNLAGQVMS